MRRSALLLLLVPALAWGQQYRWTDERGRVQYSDSLPPASAKNVQKMRFGDKPAAADPVRALEEAARQFPVTIYTSPNCEAPCRDARQLLDQRGIAFTEVAVLDAQSLAELKRAVGEEKIPALQVGPKAHVGFSPGAWNAALDAAQYPSAAAAAAAGIAKTRPLPPITLYTNSECGSLCSEARSHLQSRNVEFTEVAVEDAEGVKSLRTLTGGQNVPVLTVGDVVQRGYDSGLYDRALGSAGYPQTAK